MKRPNDISDPTDYEPIAKRLTHYPRHEQKEDEKEVNAVERVARGYYRNDVFHTPLKRVGNYRYAMHAYPDDGEIDVELVIEEVDGTGHWSFRPGATIACNLSWRESPRHVGYGWKAVTSHRIFLCAFGIFLPRRDNA